MAVVVFVAFVVFVVGLSLYLGRRARTSSGYYAAGGNIHWGVNGIAFAGDYLSAASFLGICGLIATAGFDGFLYSIGYLAGWVVALFVVAEPLKRLGKFTFTDAVDAKYDSRGIKLFAADQHPRRLDLLPHPADGGRGRPHRTPARPAVCLGSDHRRGDRDHHRRDRRHGVHDICAVPQGRPADLLLRDPCGCGAAARLLHRARPGRRGALLRVRLPAGRR